MFRNSQHTIETIKISQIKAIEKPRQEDPVGASKLVLSALLVCQQLSGQGHFDALAFIVIEHVQSTFRHVAGGGLRHRDLLGHEPQAIHLAGAGVAQEDHAHVELLADAP